MAQITVQNLTFAYDGSYDNVFSGVSFTMDTDWRLGLIGRNGRGKTTLLRLLQGGLDYRGSISAPVSFEYFPYEARDDSLPTREIVSEISPQAQDWEVEREFALLGMSPDTLDRAFHTLSYGERTKALLAALFLRENSFLLIDEPTNHLDMETRELMVDYLGSKKGFILVSHDRVFLDACIDHVVSINRDGIEVQKGNFTTWSRNREMKESYELAQDARLKKDIKKLEQAAKRTANWSDDVEKSKQRSEPGTGVDRGHVGRMAAKMMKRSKSIERRQTTAIEEKQQLLRGVETADSLILRPQRYHKGTLVSGSGLRVDYGERTVLDGLDFTVKAGERVGVLGRNGCGKSTLLRLITGEITDFSGTLEVGSGLKISYISQDTAGLRGQLSDYCYEHDVSESLFKAILRKLGFERVQFEKDMESFSGGQKKKVLIARSLCEQAHLYIWDEPLNFIDVISRMQIEALITQFEPTMIFVEHDRAFVDNIATRVLRL